MVTGHRLVDGLIQEYWGLFIKWDTAMYQVGTECFVPRSFHSHVSLKVGGIWWFAIHHEFPPVSTECPQKFPWNSTSESETVASHSHINQAELRKFPWYDCPLYKARAIVDSAISSPIQLPVIQKMLPCPVFQLHLWSFFTAIWCHMIQKKISNPQDSEIGIPFFKQPRQFEFSRCQLEKASCRPLDTVPTLRGTWLTWWTYYMYIIYTVCIV